MITASPLAAVESAIVSSVVAALAGRSFAYDGANRMQSLPVYHGAADPKAKPPYVLVGDSSNAQKFSTLGPMQERSDVVNANRGATVRVPVRIVTKYPTSQEQAHRMMDPIQARLDGQRITVDGFGRSIVTFENMTMLTSMVNNEIVRELFTELDVAVHQSS